MEYLLILVLAGAGDSTGASDPAPDVEEAFSRLPERLRISPDGVEAVSAAKESTFAFDGPELDLSLDMLLYSSDREADDAPDGEEAFYQLSESLRISLDWVEAAQGQLMDAPRYTVDRLELTPFLGMLLYSSAWEADPAFSFGVQALLPLPGIMDGFGAFAQISVSRLERDIDTLTDKDDRAFFATIGADYTFIQKKTFRAHVQTGLLYGSFGKVSDTEDGTSFILGVSGSLKLSKGLWLSYNPQFGLADDSEWLFFHHLGLSITF